MTPAASEQSITNHFSSTEPAHWPSLVSCADLVSTIGCVGAPTIVDVRIDDDFALDERLIPGSIRRSHRDCDAWMASLRGQSVVIVCHKGLKLSWGVTALLRDAGIAAAALQNGFEGWSAAGLSAVPSNPLSHPRGGSGRWVSGVDASLDAMMCAWLIRRFVARDARLLFVETSQIEGVADRLDAVPFAIDRDGDNHYKGFDALLGELELSGWLPLRQFRTSLIGSELPVIARGMRQLHPLDELSRCHAMMPVLDALYSLTDPEQIK